MLSFLIKKSAFLDSHQLHSAFFSSLRAPLTSVHMQHPDTFQLWSDLNHQLGPWHLPAFTHTPDFEAWAAKSPYADSCSGLALTSSPTQPGRSINTSTWLWCDTAYAGGKFLQHRGACPVTLTTFVIVSHFCAHGPQGQSAQQGDRVLVKASKRKLTWSVGVVGRTHRRFFLASIFLTHLPASQFSLIQS